MSSKSLVSLEEYLSRRGMYELYLKALGFLPILKEKKIFVKMHEHASSPGTFNVSRDLEEENVWYVSLGNDPLDPLTLLWVFAYVATQDKDAAERYSFLLLYAINDNLPCFNFFDLFYVDLETVNSILREFYGLRSVEDYFTLVGVVPLEIAKLDHDTMKVKLKENVPENVIVRVFLDEIINKIITWYNPIKTECILIECTIFKELASILSKQHKHLPLDKTQSDKVTPV